MAAGIFGYMGYDTVRLIEHLPDEKSDALGLPDSILVRPTLIVIFDSVKDEMTVVTPVRPAPGVSAKAAEYSWERAARLFLANITGACLDGPARAPAGARKRAVAKPARPPQARIR